MSGVSVSVRGRGNVVVCGNDNVVSLSPPGGRNLVQEGDGARTLRVLVPAGLLRQVEAWGRRHGSRAVEMALLRLAAAGLAAEERRR